MTPARPTPASTPTDTRASAPPPVKEPVPTTLGVDGQSIAPAAVRSASVRTGLQTCPKAATPATNLSPIANPSIQIVSRETICSPSRTITASANRRRRFGTFAAIAAILALLAAACGAPPGPQGWAPAHPVKVDSQNIVLVPHRSKLYALPKDSTNALWQFPPKDKSTYPYSTESRDRLNALVDSSAADATAKADLKRKVADLTLSNPAKDVLNQAVAASSATADEQKAMKDLVDVAGKFESGALGNLQALYGDLGVSSDGKTTYVPTFRGMVFALETTTGKALWIRDAGDELVGGIAVDGDTIYLGTKGNRVFAINAKTGVQKWQFTTRGQVWATPTVDGDTLYVTSLDGSLYALNKSDGSTKWTFDSASSGIASHPLVAGGLVYIGAFDNKLYAINTSDGTQKWSIKAGNWFWATPVIDAGTLYAAALDGKVYAVDASTGGKKWDKPFDADSAIRSAPVVAGGGLIVAVKNGNVYKLDLDSGALQGDPQKVSTKILSDLTLDGSTLYVNADQAALFVFDMKDGPLETAGNLPLPN